MALQKFLLQFCVLLCQQYHSSQIDGALMLNDSKIILYKILPVPKNCVLMTFRFSDASRNFRKLFTVS